MNAKPKSDILSLSQFESLNRLLLSEVKSNTVNWKHFWLPLTLRHINDKCTPATGDTDHSTFSSFAFWNIFCLFSHLICQKIWSSFCSFSHNLNKARWIKMTSWWECRLINWLFAQEQILFLDNGLGYFSDVEEWKHILLLITYFISWGMLKENTFFLKPEIQRGTLCKSPQTVFCFSSSSFCCVILVTDSQCDGEWVVTYLAYVLQEGGRAIWSLMIASSYESTSSWLLNWWYT